jgi:hypothetical protein
VAGLVVAGIGLFLLLGRSVPDMGRWIPLVVGLIFMAAFLARREYGFLVPGGIITGVGVLLSGVVDADLEGAVTALSLAGGFLAIWVLGAFFRLPQNHWWPFIPGGILAIVGMVRLADAGSEGVVRWWPLVLVLIGALIIGRTFLQKRT